MIENFINEEGQIKRWPAKQEMKKAILEYMSTKFEVEKKYSEKEVNEIISSWHTFSDLFILRRGMIDYGYMKRTRDGKEYWRSEEQKD